MYAMAVVNDVYAIMEAFAAFGIFWLALYKFDSLSHSKAWV